MPDAFSRVAESLMSAPRLKIAKRQKAKLYALLSSLARELGLGERDERALQGMFCTKAARVPVFDAMMQCEFAFGFWGYLKHDAARRQLLQVLLLCTKPRMYSVSETRAGTHVEGCVVLRLSALGLSRAGFEEWLDSFFAKLGVSAGIVVFQQYMDAQMMACLHRIELGQKHVSNMHAQENKDFRMLYGHLRQRRGDEQRVREFTRLEFTPDNFVDIFVREMLRREGVLGASDTLRRIPDARERAARSDGDEAFAGSTHA